MRGGPDSKVVLTSMGHNDALLGGYDWAGLGLK